MTDVVIVGGGICGCSLLYQLSRYRVQAVLVEKENDVGVGTTKANSAIVHAGYDPHPGTLMAKYNVRGNEMVRQLCADLDILYRATGSLVVGFDEKDEALLRQLYERGVQNGVPGLRVVVQQELRQMEPNISPEATSALYAPTGAVVNPWELASAQAEVAVQNGAEVRLNTQVTGIRKTQSGFVLETTSGEIETRFVVNAAGVHAAQVSGLAGDDSFHILPDKGQYFLLDTTQGNMVKHVIFQCPTPNGKGVLVAPTVHGNLIVGPNNQKVLPDDTTTSAEGLGYVRVTALRSVPGIDFRQSIRNFAGVRAAADVDDFIVGPSRQAPGLFHMAGIKSPGLTAAPAIAEDMVQMLIAAGLPLQAKQEVIASRSITRFKYLPEAEKAQAIQQNPLYGSIVCRCETVTEGELVDALRRPLPPRSVDAVKRRCSPGMGRCQGGFCGPRVQAIIARELGIPQQDVPLDRAGMDIVLGPTKQPKGGDGA